MGALRRRTLCVVLLFVCCVVETTVPVNPYQPWTAGNVRWARPGEPVVTSRPTWEASTVRNTLMDDADDLQRQLDNEAQERFTHPKPWFPPKTVWTFRLPSRFAAFCKQQQHCKDGPREVRIGRRDVASSLSLRKRKIRRHKHEYYTDEVEKKAEDDYFSSDEDEEEIISTENLNASWWSYSNMMEWSKWFPSCAGKYQSPVLIPAGALGALSRVRTTRPLLFINYDKPPTRISLKNDGNRLILTAAWPRPVWPSLWGGAAQSRRYLFHSVELHWPSEHFVNYDQFAMELQAVHVAAEYGSMKTALKSGDPEALLIVAYLFQVGKETIPSGVEVLLKSAALASKNDASFSDINEDEIMRKTNLNSNKNTVLNWDIEKILKEINLTLKKSRTLASALNYNIAQYLSDASIASNTKLKLNKTLHIPAKTIINSYERTKLTAIVAQTKTKNTVSSFYTTPMTKTDFSNQFTDTVEVNDNVLPVAIKEPKKWPYANFNNYQNKTMNFDRTLVLSFENTNYGISKPISFRTSQFIPIKTAKKIPLKSSTTVLFENSKTRFLEDFELEPVKTSTKCSTKSSVLFNRLAVQPFNNLRAIKRKNNSNYDVIDEIKYPNNYTDSQLEIRAKRTIKRIKKRNNPFIFYNFSGPTMVISVSKAFNNDLERYFPTPLLNIWYPFNTKKVKNSDKPRTTVNNNAVAAVTTTTSKNDAQIIKLDIIIAKMVLKSDTTNHEKASIRSNTHLSVKDNKNCLKENKKDEKEENEERKIYEHESQKEKKNNYRNNKTKEKRKEVIDPHVKILLQPIKNNTKPTQESLPYAMTLLELFPKFSHEYATYTGSQTSPPCKEIVRWIIYSRPLTVSREVIEMAKSLQSMEGQMNANARSLQALNDRVLYYFY